MNAPRFLVWSNEHAMWWRGNQRGYTQYIEEAGRYDRAEAEGIVSRASLDGQLGVRRDDPVTGGSNLVLPEVMVQAPEEIPGALQWAVKYLVDENHYDTVCDDRPYCQIAEHHADES